MSSRFGPESWPTSVGEAVPADQRGCDVGERTHAGRNLKRKASSSQSVDETEGVDFSSQRKRTSLGEGHCLSPSVPASLSFTPAPGPSSLLGAHDTIADSDAGATQGHAGDSGCRHNTGKEKKPFSFFTFPAEIRNIIYSHALHYPSCADLYRTFYRTVPPRAGGTRQQTFYTPTILLLCKRITAECHAILRARPLVIDRLPPFRVDHTGSDGEGHRFLKVTDFVGRRTLQTLRYIDIRIGLGEGPLGSGWAWEKVLEEVLNVLMERNACVKLRLLIRLCWARDQPSVWMGETGCGITIFKKMQSFVDANPNVFAQREIAVEVWRIEGHQATFLKEVVWPRMEDWHLRKREVSPRVRSYPDREMFPGSIMQFVKPLPPPFFRRDDEDQDE